MKLNGVKVVERHNHPGVLSRNVLRLSLFNNGAYYDPYAVSSVSLFYKNENVSPSTVLTTSSQLISASAASSVKYRWFYSGNSDGWEQESAYSTGLADASSVYRTGVGRFAVVLDGTQSVSSHDRNGDVIANTASATGKYIDVWTVKLTENSDWQVFINDVELFQDNIIALTEPLMLRTKERLIPHIVRLGEVVDIKVPVEITIMNRNIDQSVKNTLSTGYIQNPQMLIKKHNEDSNLPSWVTVSGYDDTADIVEVTSDNTLLMNFNTSILTNGGVSNLGNGTGTYSVEVKYQLFDETIISPMMYFTVR